MRTMDADEMGDDIEKMISEAQHSVAAEWDGDVAASAEYCPIPFPLC